MFIHIINGILLSKLLIEIENIMLKLLLKHMVELFMNNMKIEESVLYPHII